MISMVSDKQTQFFHPILKCFFNSYSAGKISFCTHIHKSRRWQKIVISSLSLSSMLTVSPPSAFYIFIFMKLGNFLIGKKQPAPYRENIMQQEALCEGTSPRTKAGSRVYSIMEAASRQSFGSSIFYPR